MVHRVMVMVLAAWAAGGLACAQSTKIVVEGEDYYSIKASMEKVMDEEASGGAYVHIPFLRHRPMDPGPTDDGNATFKISVPVSGTYYLYGLCCWYPAPSMGNSFFVSVDDGEPKVFGNDGIYKKWHWVPMVSRTNPNPFRYELSAGEHTIRFQNREDGARLDQFLLTNNMRYTPAGKETRTPQYIIEP